MRANDGLHLDCVEVVGPGEVPARGGVRKEYSARGVARGVVRKE